MTDFRLFCVGAFGGLCLRGLFSLIGGLTAAAIADPFGASTSIMLFGGTSAVAARWAFSRGRS